MTLLFSNSTTRQAESQRAPALSSPDDNMLLLAARVRHLVPPAQRHFVGDFIQPRSRQMLGKTDVWAADNDAFSGFNPDRFRRMLDTILHGVIERRGHRPPTFVTVPDVVCDHFATLELYEQWSAEIGGRGLARAFVLQNGIEAEWERRGLYALPGARCEDADESGYEALFIGGDTPFKFSPVVTEIVRHAKAMGKWVHMGRVNSVRRMEYANSIGCDSVDGSGMARFPNSVLLPMLKALHQEQMFLF